MQFVDGLVLASIGLLVFAFFLPHVVEQGGWAAVAAFAIGVALPTALERVRGVMNQRVHDATLFVGMLALALHALTDGMALTEQAASGQPALAAAVVLHQFPVGLAVWWLVRSAHGKRAALLVLAGISLATALGYVVGGELAVVDSTLFLLLLAFVAGSLIHVLIHSHLDHVGHTHDHDHDRGSAQGDTADAVASSANWPGALGAAFGIGAVVVAASSIASLSEHAAGLEVFGRRFLHYALESAPALLLGYGLAGLLVQFMPAASVRWLGGGTNRAGQAARGIVYGLPLPVCSCGVVPLYGSLARAGAPPAAALAFLVATPELGIEAFVLSFPLLGVEMTLVRLLAAAALAFFVAMVVSRFVPAVAPAGSAAIAAANDGAAGIVSRLRDAARHGFVKVLDDTAPWILAGLIVAALIAPEALQPLLTGLPAGVDVLVCAVLGIPMYVCASGATPLAAALIAAGVSPGAGLTFLLSGPATNVTTFGLLSRLHGRSAAVAFGVAVIGAAAALGFVANALLDPGTIAAAHLHAMTHGPMAKLALAILTVAFALSVARQGPREFISTLFEFGGEGQVGTDANDGQAPEKACCHCGDEAAESPSRAH